MNILRYIKEHIFEILVKIGIGSIVFFLIFLIVAWMFSARMNGKKWHALPEYKFTSEIVDINGIQYIRDCRYHKGCCEYILDDCKVIEIKK